MLPALTKYHGFPAYTSKKEFALYINHYYCISYNISFTRFYKDLRLDLILKKSKVRKREIVYFVFVFFSVQGLLGMDRGGQDTDPM